MYKNWLITYKCFDKNNILIKSGIMRAKNMVSAFIAQCSFEDYMKRKYKNFGHLVVDDCREEDFMGIFDNIFNAKQY